MATAFLKPTSILSDAGFNVSAGVVTDVDEGVASPDGNLIDFVTDEWTTGATRYVEFAMEDLPGGAGSVISYTLRVRAKMNLDTGHDDTLTFQWSINGTQSSTLGFPTWIQDDADTGSLADRQSPGDGSPSVADVNSWTVRVDQTVWSRSMGADGMFHSVDAFEIEVGWAGGTTLEMQDSDHLHTADNLDLVQANVLAVQDADHLNVADNIDLVQANVLALADSDHLHDAENIILSVSTLLVIADADHLHTADGLDLVQAAVLAMQDADHLHTGDNLDLVQANVLAVADSDHLHDADNIILVAAEWGDVIQVQSDALNGVTSVPVTINAAIAGNLLVCCHFTGNGDSLAPTDFDEAVAVTDVPNDDQAAIYYKVAVGGETSIAPGSALADENMATIIEIQGPFPADFFDQFQSSGPTTDLTADTGSTPATSTADQIAIALVTCRAATLNHTAWTNSFIEQSDSVASSNKLIATATKLLTATGVQRAQATISSSILHMGLIATFSKDQLGANLVLADSDHLHDADNLDLVQANVLALNDSDHLHTGDNLDLVQANVLAMQAADHVHTADNLDLDVSLTLVVADSDHLHTGDNLDLIQANVLAMAEAFHAHVADNLDLVQANVLALADSDHLHDAENIVLSVSILLVVAEAFHLHVADALDLVQAHVLAVAGSDHLHTGDNVDLTQANVLALADSDHLHTGDNLILDVSAILAMQDADHLHTGDNLDLVQASVLVVQDADHLNVGDNLDLIQAAILAIDEAFHDHTADVLVLTPDFLLTVAEAVHDHTADNIDLVQAAILAIDEAFHAHIGDQADLITGLSLIVSDAVHQVVSDNLNLFDPLGTLPEGIVFTIDGKDRDFVINAKDRVFLIRTKDRVFVVLPGNRV